MIAASGESAVVGRPPVMAQLVDRLPRHRLDSLVSAAGWERILRTASTLPPLSGGMLEVHPYDLERRADLLIRATGSNGGSLALAGENPEWDIPEASLEGDIWRRIRRFARKWADPRHPLSESVENAWLEFDLLPGHLALTEPSMFVDLDRHGRYSADQRLTTLQHSMDALDYTLTEDFMPELEAILHQGAVQSHLRHVGFMFPRSGSALRICLAELSADDIAACLSKLGCVEQACALQGIIEAYACSAKKLMLDLDVSPAIGSKVGIEVLPARSAWPEIFERMSVSGYCTREQADAFMHWPGELPLAGGAFRESLCRVTGREVTEQIRRISHVKFVATDSGHLISKVYLYFGYA
ncbi:hypothetical protein ACUNV4_02325 [Granulosicoccus sp. 3-233]|uniref:hypothetical protein n=1 Tax=Granulosicoccus sp. 3-233 TaxID=3417969 RepID=UPI003D3524A9